MFTLLLFDGKSASADGYDALAAIADQVRAKHGDLVKTFIVTPQAERPADLPEELAVVLDTEGALEAAYGAQTECLYLVRPDGYIGFRSQPANGAALEEYFRKVLA